MNSGEAYLAYQSRTWPRRFPTVHSKSVLREIDIIRIRCAYILRSEAGCGVVELVERRINGHRVGFLLRIAHQELSVEIGTVWCPKVAMKCSQS
jgi:hypothetical protein